MIEPTRTGFSVLTAPTAFITAHPPGVRASGIDAKTDGLC
jgi:hypothetical protein